MRQSIAILLLIPALGLAQVSRDSADAAPDAGNAGEEVAQKIRMIDLILQRPDLPRRLEASHDEVARDLLASAEENFAEGQAYYSRGQYLEAEAVLDYVLRNLSAALQLLNIAQQKKNRYQQQFEQLESFVFPQWRDLAEDDQKRLEGRLQDIEGLREEAFGLADAERWDEATAVLERAYRMKVSLIDDFDHHSLVVYDLDFETKQDEYRYLVSRAYHYLDLVQLAFARRAVEEPVRKLADRYLYRSMLGLEQAEEYEGEGRFEDAIPILDDSINQMSTVLKMLGVKI